MRAPPCSSGVAAVDEASLGESAGGVAMSQVIGGGTGAIRTSVYLHCWTKVLLYVLLCAKAVEMDLVVLIPTLSLSLSLARSRAPAAATQPWGCAIAALLGLQSPIGGGHTDAVFQLQPTLMTQLWSKYLGAHKL